MAWEFKPPPLRQILKGVTMLEIIQKSITEVDAKYIAHQCNCLTTKAAGVAAVIFNAFPYADVYRTRNNYDVRVSLEQPSSKNKRDQPGTIEICGNGKDQRFVINMFAQVYPGSPKYTESNLDGYDARKKYFAKCLDLIVEIKDLESIAFPYKIGCNLAGGDWENYQKMLEEFSDKINAKILICKIVD